MKFYYDVNNELWSEREIEAMYEDYLRNWEHEFSYLPKQSYEEFKEEFLAEE